MSCRGKSSVSVVALAAAMAWTAWTGTAHAQRVSDGLILLYDFADPSGDGTSTIVPDVSGVEPALDLVIDPAELGGPGEGGAGQAGSRDGLVSWGGSWLNVNKGHPLGDGTGHGTADAANIVSPGPATKLYDRLANPDLSPTNAVTLEAWIRPESPFNESNRGRIVVYRETGAGAASNIYLGQQGHRSRGMLAGLGGFEASVTTTTSGGQEGSKLLSDGGLFAGGDLMHIVLTFDSNGGGPFNFYVHRDGDPFAGTLLNDAISGTLADAWDPSYILSLANRGSLNRWFGGEYHLLAFYERALSAAEVEQNFLAGPKCAAVDVVSHARPDPFTLTSLELPAQLTVRVATPAATDGSVTIDSTNDAVATDTTIAFAADGSECSHAIIDVTGVGSTTLELSNDFGADNGASRQVIVTEVIDLGDVASAGDGRGNKLPVHADLVAEFGQVVGVDQELALFAVNRFPNEITASLGAPLVMDGSDNAPDAPSDPTPYIDVVFLMTDDTLAINSAGVQFAFDPGDSSATGFGLILDGWEVGGANNLGFGLYVSNDGLGIHSSAGITYNLDALRATHGDAAVQFFSAAAGEGASGIGGTVNNYIILSDDTQIIDSQRLGPHTDDGEIVEVAIPAEAKYLTLAVGDAGDETELGRDRGVFVDAFITPTSIRDDLLGDVSVTPAQVTMFASESAQLQVVAGVIGRSGLGFNLLGTPGLGFLSSDPNVATVDSNGMINGLGGGTATVTVSVDGAEVGSALVVVRELNPVDGTPEDPGFHVRVVGTGTQLLSPADRDALLCGLIADDGRGGEGDTEIINFSSPFGSNLAYPGFDDVDPLLDEDNFAIIAEGWLELPADTVLLSVSTNESVVLTIDQEVILATFTVFGDAVSTVFPVTQAGIYPFRFTHHAGVDNAFVELTESPSLDLGVDEIFVNENVGGSRVKAFRTLRDADGNIIDPADHLPPLCAPPIELVAIMGSLGSAPDTFISPLGEDVPFTSFGLEANEPLTLNSVTSTYTVAGTVPTPTLVDNGGGQHTVMLDPAPVPGHWLKLELNVTGKDSNQTATLTVWVAHQPLDINQDGQTTIGDATTFGNVFGGSRAEPLIDINGDGQVNVQDATAFGADWPTWRNTQLPAKP